MIIYISRGLLSSLTEAKDVMEMISYYNGRMDNRIIINTYAVIDSKFEKAIIEKKKVKKNIKLIVRLQVSVFVEANERSSVTDDFSTNNASHASFLYF